jgi:Putative F0F1-ATPase subunit Ca2+/Mg2+ transporter
MKLLKTNTRVSTTDPLGHGMDAAFMIVLFFGAGFGLDRLFGTTPIFMIVLTVLGAVGLFATFWYRYEARMQELEAERAGARAPVATANRPEPSDAGDAR